MKNSTPGGNLYLNKVYSVLKRGLVYGRTYVEQRLHESRTTPGKEEVELRREQQLRAVSGSAKPALGVQRPR